MQVGRTRHSRSDGLSYLMNFLKPKPKLGLPPAVILSINNTQHKTGARLYRVPYVLVL
jgi:hypothetical protein